MTAMASTIHLCFAYVWQSQPEWEKERKRRGKEREEGREHVVRAALQSESESEQRNLLHCLGSIATPLPLRSVCLSNNLAAVWGRHRARGRGRCSAGGGGVAAVASQMLILIKINALGHVEVEKLARLTFFVAFSICLAFAWPLSGSPSPSPPSTLHPC